MSVPTEFDFAQIKIGDGGDPESFTVICDVVDVNINTTAQTNDRFRRDCTKPGEVPTRIVKVTGKQLDISGTGIHDTAQIATLQAAVGESKNYEIVGYEDDGTDAGAEIGTYAGAFVMTADNLAVVRDGDGGLQIDLANNGAWTYTAA